MYKHTYDFLLAYCKMLIIFILLILFMLIFKYQSYNNDLYILKDFYDDTDFNTIVDYCKKLSFKKDKRVSSRKTTCLKYKYHKYLYKLVYNKKLSDFIFEKTGRHFIIPTYPIEYRLYPNGSKGLKMHKDLSLFDNDYYECVITLENTSDSKFLYILNNILYSTIPHENTLVMVKPVTVEHGVTMVNYGYRTILKFIIMFDDNKPNKNFYNELKNCPD